MFVLKRQWSTVLIIALILLVVLFAVLNVDPVTLNFGFTTVDMPLVVVIIGTLLIGVLIAVMWSTTIVMRERNKQKKLNQQIEALKSENQKEKQALTEKHVAEKESLQEDMDKMAAENRELNRRIQNMETSRTIQKSGSMNENKKSDK